MSDSTRNVLVQTVARLRSQTSADMPLNDMRRIGARILDVAADPSLEWLGAAMWCVGEAWAKGLGKGDRVETAFEGCGVLYGYARDRREQAGGSRGVLIHAAYESLRSLAESRQVYLRGLASGSEVTEAEVDGSADCCERLARRLLSMICQDDALRAVRRVVEDVDPERLTPAEVDRLQKIVQGAVHTGVPASKAVLVEALAPVLPGLVSVAELAFPLRECVKAWNAGLASARRKCVARSGERHGRSGRPRGRGRGCQRKMLRECRRRGAVVGPKRRTGETVVWDPFSGRRIVTHAGRKDASRKLRSLWDAIDRRHRRRSA
jgi:hypothetical protein